MTAPIAAVDCGTNTIKLLVARPDGAGGLDDVVRESTVVRLGQGVDRTGRLDDEALARTFEAVERYAATCREHGVGRIRFCATSATRDASNAAAFGDGVEQRLGVRPEVLTGTEEAALSFAGAVRHLREQPETPVLVVDIGGGSTELILGSTEPEESLLDGRRVGAASRAPRVRRPAHRARDRRGGGRRRRRPRRTAPSTRPAPSPSWASPARSPPCAAAVLDLPGYDRDAIDQAVLAVDDVHAAVDRLVAMTVADRTALCRTCIPAGRT